MTRREDHDAASRVEDALDVIWDHIRTPSREELRTTARSAKSEPRSTMARPRLGHGFRARWAVAGAVVVLLVGSGLGFGLARSVTPSVTARPQVAGLGFLPAHGWRVLQSEAVGSGGSGHARAANVALRASDELGELPYATLESLPPHGVVLDLTVTPRGNFVDDVDFAPRRLPLTLDVAEREVKAAASLSVASYRLRAAVGAYNLDIWIYYGTNPPSPTAFAAAQEQLNRLVVASEEVTLVARPLIITWGQGALIHGAVASGRANEIVTVEAKECVLKSFHEVLSARTGDGGTWQGEVRPGVTTELRAVWNGKVSRPVTVQQRVGIVLRQKSRRLFRVSVTARTQFWRKRIAIQQRRGSSWHLLKSVVLDEQGGGGSFVVTSADFTVSVRRGTSIRAVFSNAAARPCLLGGVSNVIRT